MTLIPGAGLPPWLLELREKLLQHHDERHEVIVKGWRLNGTDGHIRFQASRVTEFVRVHLQKTTAGGGDYNLLSFDDSDLVDCRQSRQQDYTFTASGTDRYWCWLIPAQIRNGVEYLFDGEDGRPDYASYVDFGDP